MSDARLPPVEMSDAPLRIEMWSDVVCPFCWVGKRHLEEAVRRLGIEDEVEVVHRAFQLNPALTASMPLRAYLARRFGGEEQGRRMSAHVEAMGERAGLRFDFGRAILAPTRDAHRLVRLAAREGKSDAMVERLMRAHFAEAEDLGDRATLRRLAAEAGLDAEAAERHLASGEGVEEVRADQREAQALGAGGVPFFVLGGRYGVSGAQPVEVFMEALRRARLDDATPARPDA